MYKNVSNQDIVVCIILFGSCFSALSQTIAANTATVTADTRSDHPPASFAPAAKPQQIGAPAGFCFRHFYFNVPSAAKRAGYRNASQSSRVYPGCDYDHTSEFFGGISSASERVANNNSAIEHRAFRLQAIR